jgi:RNA polymerase sigma-70 factor (ECF subfamily)
MGAGRQRSSTPPVLQVRPRSAADARPEPTTPRPTEVQDGDDLERSCWTDPQPDFDRFCATERGPVVGLAYALCGDWGAAEDLAQDAFFAAYRQWSRIGSYDHPGAWVRRVVANRAVSRRRRLTSEAVAVARLAARRRPTSEAPPLDQEVWTAVRRLPARQAQVFALTYVDDLSLDQVAAVLQISAGTAKTHLQRARAALTASLTPPAPRPETAGDPR